MTTIYDKISQLTVSGQKAALCILIETSGSTPRKAGAKMIVMEDGKTIDTIGGGQIEKTIIENAISVMEKGVPEKFSYDLEESAEMHCGGSVEVYIEPILPVNHLLILGAGHVGKAVASYASTLGFRISVIDNREDLINEIENKNTELICDDYMNALKSFNFSDKLYIVVTTPKHEYDEELTAYCARQPHKYLGMIGSKRKVAKAKERFKSEFGITQADIDKIDMPIGIEFNAQSPEEIAISIVAKLIDTKNKLHG
jgi:xanthine dehydrogenase accessory factor